MLELRNLTKKYSTKNGQDVVAINDVSLTFEEKGMVFLLGKSGSGKSTMLNLIGGLDTPDSGEIIIKGKNCKDFSTSDFDSYRNTFIGFVFQDYNLLEEFTLEENIALAFNLQGKKDENKRVSEILKLVELDGMENRKPNTLSGGQKQRIAIARALIKDPEIILADEPTGALDSKTGKQIFDILKELSKNKLVIVVSHDREFAERYADRIIELKDGRVISDHVRQNIEAKKLNQNVSIIEGKTAVIKNVKDLTEQDLKEILTSISDGEGEAVITAKKEELESVKQSFGLLEEGGKRNFVKTDKVNVKNYGKDDTKFIASKLPLKNAVKMSVGSLKAKPIRLAFTIFLSVLAFSMFGVLSTLMLYKPSYTLSKALSTNGYTSVVVSRGAEYNEITYHVDETGKQTISEQRPGQKNVLFSNESLQYMNSNNVGMNFAGVFNLSRAEIQNDSKPFSIDVSFDNKDLLEFYRTKSIFGFSDAGEEYLIKNGITLVGDYPTEVNQIAVSDYIYNMINDSWNYPAVTSIETLIGTHIEFKQGSDKPYKLEIVGVFTASDLSEYYELKYRTESEKHNALRQQKLTTFATTIKRSFETLGFVSPSFYEAYGSGVPVSYSPKRPDKIPARGLVIDYGEPPETSTITKELTWFDVYSKSRIDITLDACEFYDVVDESPMEFTLSENEIFLHEAKYEELSKSYTPAEIKELQLYAKNYKGEVRMLNVKGYYKIKNTDKTKLYIVHDSLIEGFSAVKPHTYNQKVTDYVHDNTEKYNFLISHCDASERQVNFILNRNGDIYYSIVNGEYQKLFSNEVMNFVDQIKNIFIVAAVVVGVFSALMLFNFISASINAKRKEIGILRAVGATGKDVFKIFACESALLTGISFVIASLLAFITCLILNNVTLGMSGLVFCKYGIVNVLLILLISVSISLVATIAPVVKEAKKSPVESIRRL